MPALRLNREVLGLDRSPQREGLFCIDFGTALSKAVASQGRSGYRPLLLPLGRLAGDPRAANRYVAQSSLFIDRDRVVHFGHGAVEAWARQRNYAIARIDSMKQWLSTGPIADLDGEFVDEAFLPSNCSLTKGDALTLILAYITDLAGEALEKEDLSRHARRRFTRPVWEADRARWCDEIMTRYLLRAQLVADSLSGKWRDGIVLDDAKELIERAKGEDVPKWLVEPNGVLEPVAAGHARMEKDYQQRFVALVVDVGAGTTDLAVFAGIQADGSVGITRAVPRGRSVSLSMAGDYLDDVLKRQILEGFPASDRSDVVVRQVEGRAREFKEILFTNGELKTTFVGGLVGPQIIRSDFVSLGPIREFTQVIGSAAGEVLQSVRGLTDLFAESHEHPLSEISVLASGGGAMLPMIRQLAQGRREIGRHRFVVRDAGPAPGWFTQNFKDDPKVFYQMAVAIGGSFPRLPAGAPPADQIRRGMPL